MTLLRGRKIFRPRTASIQLPDRIINNDKTKPAPEAGFKSTLAVTFLTEILEVLHHCNRKND
jgi:hypothetical protein